MNPPATASLSDLFVFPFRGKDWALKLLIAVALPMLGALLLFIPSLFVFGYRACLMRRVIAGQPPGLPAWDAWGKLYADAYHQARTRLAEAGLLASQANLE